ncbi:MAG: bifunctional (p)ppGpp synthetase/guanosine-3',5'-bis(diphosphate) 3'-pyrophosphohydrolase [Peptococcaceae bacterium]|nr:bifunctional (p)ppGpp synthetase/guanosine-3',5'-bis(diphosphate) 3'-pyrophosphohydrolase [Peptococcaceae bacterium]MBQ5682177.1 bifunctional (p)ppGpp synthetase/guanosine-3',5'-bis(diphosphate) 3'-pyrophosphohydrolase [Peptococcaceae bacterium]MBQ5702994.1 bifunctional (p)ppGpp synthetase/guanosine-3',5'-bis(diphosphate) 3'-pyrophosphohydrolase [Peptococcaceae bacterium]
MTRFKDLVDAVYKNNPNADIEYLEEVYRFAEDLHKDQYRKSGEAYIIHPLSVAIILAELGMDETAVAAGLLHDVVEDTSCKRSGIADHFGEDVAFIVNGVTKLSKLECNSKEERQLESYRKMFLSMAEDVRVVMIKLADRLHNMRTLRFQKEEKQRAIAQETLEIYAPIANRLGISKVKWELEDLCLRYLEPEAFYDLVERISMKRDEREEYIQNIIGQMTKELDKVEIKAEISGRPKHFFSIYNKMKKQNKDLDELYDLIAVRLLVDSVKDCYAALGIVHTLWRPIPMRFKDYIAMPKPNMYQSLHTTVIGPNGDPFEIQIRTYEMHHTAEYGIAAHWIYKESGGSEISKDNSQLSWLEQIKEMQNEASDSKDFLSSLKIDLFSDTVFVFSPKGEVYELPQGSGPLDFAYKVHSGVGNSCMGAKVNKKIVPLDYQLKNGDIVEILTSKQAKPSLDWVNLCKTSQARNKIRQWFKKEGRDENMQRGKDSLEAELKKKDIEPSAVLHKQDTLIELANRMGYSSWDDVCVGIGNGSLTALQVANKLYDEYQKYHKVKPQEETVESLLASKANKEVRRKQQDSTKKGTGGIIVEGFEGIPTRFASCCKPLPGDPVVGYITRGRGVTIHHLDCPNIKGGMVKEADRYVHAYWDMEDSGIYQVEVFVIAIDRPKITPEVMSLINDSKVHITAISSRVKEGKTYMNISIEVRNLDQVILMIDKIKSISDVLEVKRTIAD